MASVERVRGSDSAAIAKYDGLPALGKRIQETPKLSAVLNAPNSFISTMDPQGVLLNSNMNPILATSLNMNQIEKPKFMAKITLFDSHSTDNF